MTRRCALQATRIDTLGALPYLWNEILNYHPHVHMIVDGGGLWADEELWLAARSDFLMPVRALSVLVAAKFRDGLKKQAPRLYEAVDPSVWLAPWVVHCRSVGKEQAALKYLAQYIFRPAISNGRLVSLDNAMLSFRYQPSQTGRWKVCRLEAIEFIRRYLQHVLPRGFVKVRYYGLYGHRHRERLNRLRGNLEKPTREDATEPSLQTDTTTSSQQPLPKAATCRCCGQPMLAVATIPRGGPWPKAPPPGYCSATDQPKQTAIPL